MGAEICFNRGNRIFGVTFLVQSYFKISHYVVQTTVYLAVAHTTE